MLLNSKIFCAHGRYGALIVNILFSYKNYFSSGGYKDEY